MSVDTKYNHLRNGTLYGGATIGWSIQDDDTLITALAKCNNVDRFVKSEGRVIVDMRINNYIANPEKNTSKYVAVVTLDEVRAFLYENSERVFPVLNRDATLRAIESVTMRDFNYNTHAFITQGVFDEIL
jgi:hypothetical protein